MADRIKAIVTSALALGALAIPGFEALETVLGGPDSIVQAALGGYALYHTIALAVDWAHGKTGPAVALAPRRPRNRPNRLHRVRAHAAE